MDGAQKLALPGCHSLSFSCRKLTASWEEEDYIPEWYRHTHFLNQPSINALGSFLCLQLAPSRHNHHLLAN